MELRSIAFINFFIFCFCSYKVRAVDDAFVRKEIFDELVNEVKHMNRRLAVLEERNEKLTKIEHMVNTELGENGLFDQLLAAADKMSGIEKRMDALEKQVDAMKESNQLAIDGVNQDDGERNRINTKPVTAPISDNTKDVHDDKHVLQKRQNSQPKVAFTAGISVPHLSDLGVHQTIVFDKILTNVGDAYHHNTGIFTVPVTGTYVVCLNVVPGKHGVYGFYEIALDGSQLADIVIDSTVNETVYSSHTKLWVFRFQQGAEVWVRTTSYGDLREIHGYMHSMFSAWLLFPEE